MRVTDSRACSWSPESCRAISKYLPWRTSAMPVKPKQFDGVLDGLALRIKYARLQADEDFRFHMSGTAPEQFYISVNHSRT